MSSSSDIRYTVEDEPLTALRQMRRTCLIVGVSIAALGVLTCLSAAGTDRHWHAFNGGLTAVLVGGGFFVVASCAHVGLLCLEQGAKNYRRMADRMDKIMRVELETAQAVAQGVDELNHHRRNGRG